MKISNYGISQINRRDFLRNTGYAGGGLIIAANLGACAKPNGLAGGDFAPNVYVQIKENGDVDIVCHRSEMGQGIRTGLPQVIADEMEADWDRINVLQAIGDKKYGDQNTDGSTSIRNHFDMLRNAGATAKHMLEAAAAAHWEVPVEECEARNHAVHHAASGQSLGYGELAGNAATLPVPEEVEFKSPSDYRYIGKPMDLLDSRALTTGAGMFGIDTVIPGMLYASIERCPAVGGNVVSVDDTAARAVAGVVDVVRMADVAAPWSFKPLGGVAVVAKDTWSAMKGRAALTIEWDMGPNGEYDSVSYRESLSESAKSAGTVALDRGDVDDALANAEKTIQASYYAPHLSQAPMEPPAATAVIREDGSCEVWACTQDPQTAQGVVAGLLGLEPEQVIINVTLLGGGFGRKSKPDFIAEAAWLAKETGKPVKVTWTREDDLRHGYLHSVSSQYLKAGLDSDGKTVAWMQRTAFPSISATFDPTNEGPSNGELGLGCVDNPYDIPNMRIESGKALAHVRIGWMRSVSNVYHAFAACSFADELAHLAGRDSKEFMVDLIGPDRHVNPADDGAEYGNYGLELSDHPIDTARHKAVLEKAAEMADWGRAMPEGHGLGIAVHRSFPAFVATVAEVFVDQDGQPHVKELWTAIDAGLVVNPDRVRSQIEGAGIFGVSLTMHGEITAENGAVVQGNFDTYPVVRMSESPMAINVHIMESGAKPGGVGEPGVPPVAPAICNAIFAATGKRVRELPLKNVDLA
jgi:isoquinoline 1-oxidoreductase beta subunit